MVNYSLKNATMAAVLTAVIVTPVFGMQLIRQGARTTMESRWNLVAGRSGGLHFSIAAALDWPNSFSRLRTVLPELAREFAEYRMLMSIYSSPR